MSQTFSRTQTGQIKQLIAYSDRYEISIQFWPEQTAVYISKHGVELTSFGGDFHHAIQSSIDYLNRINRVKNTAF